MTSDPPNCRATAIGSVPHINSVAALEFALETFSDLPFWPQLPRRAFRENMYAQFSEHLPGIQIDDQQERIWVERDNDWLDSVEAFYATFLEEDPSLFAPREEIAACLHEMVRRGPLEDAWAVKGQVTGPISVGMQVTDQDLRPSLYDDMMRDCLVKNVLRQAQWQEAQLRAVHPHTIMFIDEPILSLVGSAFASLSRDGVIEALEEVFSGLVGHTAVHCCANTDWSMLLATSVDVLSFDAYEYSSYLALYPAELRSFLARGGMLAWGLIPNTGEAAEAITLDGAWAVLERAMMLFERKGFDREELLPRSIITPACGTGTLTVPAAERVMRLARQLSDRVREECGLG